MRFHRRSLVKAQPKPIILLNPEAYRAQKTKVTFSSKDVPLMVSVAQEGLTGLVKDIVSDGFREIYICGGDGFTNNYLNAYMNLPLSERQLITSGIIPGGCANDLARELGQPDDHEAAYHRLRALQSTKKIDVIRMNGRYFATGGGLGLPTETVERIRSFKQSMIGNRVAHVLNHSIYTLFAGGLMVGGYQGVPAYAIDGIPANDDAMLISVHNQPCIGKHLHLTPRARNDDGLLDVCIIKKNNSILGDISALLDVQEARHQKKAYAQFLQKQSVRIETRDQCSFMGDGEILASGTIFQFDVIPGALRVKY